MLIAGRGLVIGRDLIGGIVSFAGVCWGVAWICREVKSDGRMESALGQ